MISVSPLAPTVSVGFQRDQVEKEGIDEDKTLLVGRRNEMLLVWRVAQVKEECRHGYVVLLIKMGYEMVLVWRHAQKEEEHIDKDEMLLVRRGYKTLLVWRLLQQEEEHIE